MGTSQLIGFLLFSVVAAVTPGPSNVILTSTGARVGVLRGLPTLFGAVLGMSVLMGLAFGLGSLLAEIPAVVWGIKALGVGFLLWLAWTIATASRGDPRRSDIVGFWKAAAFQWVNPKAWVVCASVAGTSLSDQGGPFLPSVTRALLFTVAALPSCFVWLAFGAALQGWMKSDRVFRAFHVAMGSLLALSVLLFLW